MVDQSMGVYPEWELSQVMDLAFRCTDTDDPSSRPSMTRVVSELEAVMEPDSLGSPYISRNLSPQNRLKDTSMRLPEGHSEGRRERNVSASTLSLYTLPSFGEMDNEGVNANGEVTINEARFQDGVNCSTPEGIVGLEACKGEAEDECYRAEMRARDTHETSMESADLDHSGVYSFGSLPPP